MSNKGWRSNKPFLSAVSRLKCWKSLRHDTGRVFSNDAEILYATLVSIVEHSALTGDVRSKAEAKLRDFADSLDISENRQHELRDKVRDANWDARRIIRHLGFASFIDGFVAVCLRDRKIQPLEYDLINLIGGCLDLNELQTKKILKATLSRPRYRAILFFEKPAVSALITVLIILNAIQLGLMVCPWFDPYRNQWFYRLDFAFMCLFSVEMLCRIFAFRGDFFKESQNIFDFTVVAVSWIPSPVFRWASALRIFRAMLLLNRLGQLKSIMRSLMDALPNIGWVTVLLGIFYYVFAVLTTSMFGREFAAFDSIEKSLFSLFQLMTLESWPELVKPVMARYPYSLLVFIPFMFITSYIFLNLVIGIIVTSMHDISLKRKSTEKKEIDEIRELKKQMHNLTDQIENIQKILAENKK